MLMYIYVCIYFNPRSSDSAPGDSNGEEISGIRL